MSITITTAKSGYVVMFFISLVVSTVKVISKKFSVSVGDITLLMVTPSCGPVGPPVSIICCSLVAVFKAYTKPITLKKRINR